MKKIKKRQILIVAGIVIIIAAFILTVRFFNMEGKTETQQRMVEAGPVVSVFRANPREIISYLDITGRVKPVESVRLYSEVGGILQTSGKPFKAGVNFSEGELMAKIEDEEAFQNLKAQRSSFLSLLSNLVPGISIDYPGQYETWKKYLEDFQLNEPMAPLPEVNNDQFRLYLTGKNVYTQYNKIKRQETRFAKYRIHAPFDGTLTGTRIEEGTLVRVGQDLGEFMQTGNLELEAGVTSKNIDHAKVGKLVVLSAINGDKSYQAKVIRVNEKVDPQTQTIKIFLAIRGDKNIRPGDYLKGRLEATTFQEAEKVNNNLLVQNHHLFIVEDSTATLQPVKILSMSKDSAVVTGLERGTIVVNEAKSPSFEGTKVNFE